MKTLWSKSACYVVTLSLFASTCLAETKIEVCYDQKEIKKIADFAMDYSLMKVNHSALEQALASCKKSCALKQEPVFKRTPVVITSAILILATGYLIGRNNGL